MPRCGTCANCLMLERARRRILACCNPPFSHASQAVIDLWNAELKRLPCLEQTGAGRKEQGR